MNPLNITKIFTAAGRRELSNKFFESEHKKKFDHVRTEFDKLHADLKEIDTLLEKASEARKANPGTPDSQLFDEQTLETIQDLEKDEHFKVGQRFLSTIGENKTINGTMKLLYDRRQYKGIELFGEGDHDYKEAMLESYIIAANRCDSAYLLKDFLTNFKASWNIQILKAYLMSDEDMRERVEDATIKLIKNLQNPETGRLCNDKVEHVSVLNHNNLDRVATNDGIIDMVRLSRPDTAAKLIAATINNLSPEEIDVAMEGSHLTWCLEPTEELYHAFMRHMPDQAKQVMSYCMGQDPILRYPYRNPGNSFRPEEGGPGALGLS